MRHDFNTSGTAVGDRPPPHTQQAWTSETPFLFVNIGSVIPVAIPSNQEENSGPCPPLAQACTISKVLQSNVAGASATVIVTLHPPRSMHEVRSPARLSTKRSVQFPLALSPQLRTAMSFQRSSLPSWECSGRSPGAKRGVF
jgi:hypothetical protein